MEVSAHGASTSVNATRQLLLALSPFLLKSPSLDPFKMPPLFLPLKFSPLAALQLSSFAYGYL